MLAAASDRDATWQPLPDHDWPDRRFRAADIYAARRRGRAQI